MWSILLGFLGGPLKSISNDIKEAYQSKLNAANDAERVAADERISKLESRRDVILAGQSSPTERWIRFGYALPFVLYNAKLVIWDKVFALGVTDPLGPELAQISSIVLAGFFLDAIVGKVTRVIKK